MHKNAQGRVKDMNAHQSTANPATSMTGESGLTVQVPPRWGDMDAYGHVNNVAILSLLEEARIAVFGPPPSSGQKPQNLPAPPIPLFETMPDGVQALIAEHGVRYLGQLPYTGEPLGVNVRIEKVSAASVRVGYSTLFPGGSCRVRACLHCVGFLGCTCRPPRAPHPRTAGAFGAVYAVAL